MERTGIEPATSGAQSRRSACEGAVLRQV